MAEYVVAIDSDNPRDAVLKKTIARLAARHRKGERVELGVSFESGKFPSGLAYVLERNQGRMAVLGYGQVEMRTVTMQPAGTPSTGEIIFAGLVPPGSSSVFATDAELMQLSPDPAVWTSRNGRPVPLPPAVADALALLVRNRAVVPNSTARPAVRAPDLPLPSQSFTAFCASLGTPLSSFRSSWSAIAADQRRALFTVWDDLVRGNTYEIWSPRDTHINHLPGAKEIRRVAESALANGAETIGVRCYAADTDATPRTRQTYDDKRLLVLRLIQRGDEYAARILGEVDADTARRGPLMSRDVEYDEREQAQDDAVNDLGAPPPGVDSPGRGTGGGSAFHRDPEVRAYVLRRAKGKCEFCGTPGFAMAGRRRYLETHHVISLANQGPDRVDNVIAVCAEDHRRAHYSKDAPKIEREMLAILDRLSKKLRSRGGTARSRP